MDKYEYISLQDALRLMDKLYANDISRSGIEMSFTFDAERAKKALETIPRYTDVIAPVRCKVCKYKKERFASDGADKGDGFKVYDCEKLPGGYLGDDGYCSKGEI